MSPTSPDTSGVVVGASGYGFVPPGSQGVQSIFLSYFRVFYSFQKEQEIIKTKIFTFCMARN
ncbi:Protein of unknown function [Gryllus bimaculatus]|nr:Protein of unknown function [Gryllus bimaculatus]